MNKDDNTGSDTALFAGLASALAEPGGSEQRGGAAEGSLPKPVSSSAGLGSNIQQMTHSSRRPSKGTLARLRAKAQAAPKLDQFLASAICGNDILGSCLYAAGLVAASAGRWAPLCFVFVNLLMTFFRPIYVEVGQALPVNGGTYTLLLNTSSKFSAAFAGTLTLIAYAATAVVSANSAMHYLHELFPALGLYWSVVLVLFIFSVLALIGIRESAYNAFIIFSLHIITLVVYFIACLAYLVQEDKFTTLYANLAILPSDVINALLADPTTVPAVSSSTAAAVSAASGAASTWTFSFGRDLHAIFIGFSVGLLGVTGFETSCNYIEEQAKGVYPKVIRNVWLLVSIVNPLVSFLSLAILPAEAVPGAKTHLLSSTALLAQGTWLQTLVTIDAVTVLSGAVLTAFIGVQGLVYRMAADGCLPSFFTQRSAARGTQHQTILAFFLICVSLHIVSAADIRVLSATYTCSFLMLLACFVYGDIRLKLGRSALLREGKRNSQMEDRSNTTTGILGRLRHAFRLNGATASGRCISTITSCLDTTSATSSRATWVSLIAAFVGVTIGLCGTFSYQPHMVMYSLVYIAFVFIVVQACIYWVTFLRVLAWLLSLVPALRPLEQVVRVRIAQHVQQGIVYFMQPTENKPELREALAYILANEERRLVKFVAVTPVKMNPALELSLRTLVDSLAIEYHSHSSLHLQFEAVTGVMSKSLLKSLTRRWNIPTNFMFTACPESGRTSSSNSGATGGLVAWDYRSMKGSRIIAEGPTVQKLKKAIRIANGLQLDAPEESVAPEKAHIATPEPMLGYASAPLFSSNRLASKDTSPAISDPNASDTKEVNKWKLDVASPISPLEFGVSSAHAAALLQVDPSPLTSARLPIRTDRLELGNTLGL